MESIAFSPDWVEDIVWVAQRVNRHAIGNRWLPVDETRHFELMMKEKKAVTTQQCRIVVKGAPHLPLQLSCGSSIQFLYPTWQYLKLLEAQGVLPDVPKERYKEVEDWMLDHIREFNEWRLKGDGKSAPALARPASASSASAKPLESPRSGAPLSAGSLPDVPLSDSVLTPRGHGRSEADLSNGSALSAVRDGDASSAAAAAAGKASVKERIKSLWHGFRTSPGNRPTTPADGELPPTPSLPPGQTTSTPDRGPAAPSSAGATSDGEATATRGAGTPNPAVTVASTDGDGATMGKLSKREAVKDFLRRKLGRTTERPANELDDDSSSDDEEEHFEKAGKLAADAPPSLVACESLDDFRLNWKHIRRIFVEARKRDVEGHRVHETFDRLYRRRRAVNKWQYQNRDAIFEQIKSNRTVTIMFVIGVYTTLMNVVRFDVFCFLLLGLEIVLHYLCTNYRDLAITMGRRAARTRVDRVKDWFYFGVTRRKTRNGDEVPTVEE